MSSRPTGLCATLARSLFGKHISKLERGIGNGQQDRCANERYSNRTDHNQAYKCADTNRELREQVKKSCPSIPINYTCVQLGAKRLSHLEEFSDQPTVCLQI